MNRARVIFISLLLVLYTLFLIKIATEVFGPYYDSFDFNHFVFLVILSTPVIFYINNAFNNSRFLYFIEAAVLLPLFYFANMSFYSEWGGMAGALLFFPFAVLYFLFLLICAFAYFFKKRKILN